MQVILREAVPALGEAGEVVNVRGGFARNFLLPRRLAVQADANNLQMREHERRVATTRQAKRKREVESLVEKIRALTLTFLREVGEEGKLFGSVTAQEVVAALAEHGVAVERRLIRLQEPIKAVGEYDVDIRLHPEVPASVRVRVEARGT